MCDEYVREAIKQDWEISEFPFQKTADIVVKLLGTRRSMHGNYRVGGLSGKVFDFIAYECEIGHCRGVVILPAVGVEAHKAHKARREGKVLLSENDFIDFLARSEAIVIAYEGNTWFLELSKHVAHPDKFFCLAEIGEIAQVNYEINLMAGIYVAYNFARIIVAALGVAYNGKTNRVATLANGFYFAYVLFVEVRVAMYSPVIGMIFELVATRE